MPNKSSEGKGIKLELTEAELFIVDELVEREFMRCMWQLKREQLKHYMKLLDKLGIKLSVEIENINELKIKHNL